jgi:hypothetical protein
MSETEVPAPPAVRTATPGGFPSLSTDQRRFFFWHAIVGAAVVNLTLSALIAWLSVRNEDSVPRWARPAGRQAQHDRGHPGNVFILPLLTCLIFTAVARRELRHGRVERPAGRGRRSPYFAGFRRGRCDAAWHSGRSAWRRSGLPRWRS